MGTPPNTLPFRKGPDGEYMLPPVPTGGPVRRFYSYVTLGLFHFKDGAITMEKRNHVELADGEGADTMMVFMQQYEPRTDIAFVFNFPQPLKSIFMRLAKACKNDGIEQVEVIDTEIRSRVGISILSDKRMLEALVCVAIAHENIPLVKALAPRGPPLPEDNQTRFMWNWRGSRAQGSGIPDVAATTALIRHGWLKLDHLNDNYARRIPRIRDPEAAIDRIDALIEAGYDFFDASPVPYSTYFDILHRCVSSSDHSFGGRAPFAVLRHLLSRVPMPRDVPRYSLLVAPAVKRVDGDGPAILELLLGPELGLNVDARQANWEDERRPTALLVAVQAGSVPNAQVLLRHGAKMLRDADGRTPLQLAEHLQQEEVARLLRDWLREKGLPLHYSDEEETETSVGANP